MSGVRGLTGHQVVLDEVKQLGVDHLVTEYRAACDEISRLRFIIATLEGTLDVVRAERNQAQDQRDRLMLNPGR